MFHLYANTSLVQSPKYDYFICYSYCRASIDREDCLCRLVRNFFDSSRVSSMLLLNTSSRKANSLSEYEDKSLRILSWKGIKIASIFLSHFLFLTGSIMVRRLSFGSFALLTYPTFSNLSIIPVTASGQASQLSKPPSWHRSILPDKI